MCFYTCERDIMSQSFENNPKVKKWKKYIRAQFPSLWEKSVRVAWEIRTILPSLEPLIFSQVRKVAVSMRKAKPLRNGKKILFFQTRSNPPHLAWAGTFAFALEVRGHQTMFFGCSTEQSKACANSNYPDGLSADRCRTCYLYTKQFFGLTGLDSRWINTYLNQLDIKRAEELVNTLAPENYELFSYVGLPLGQISRHSVAHYLRTGSIGSDPLSRDVYRRYLINSVLITDAASKLLDEFDPDVVLMLGGLFMPEHVMLDLAKARGKRVVVYEIAMLAQDALMMQHNRPVDYDDHESWQSYKERPLSQEESQTLDKYLYERSQGRMSVVNYWPEKEEDERRIRTELGLDPDMRTALLFPNITWDSALFEKDISFDSMFDWIDQTIEYFKANSQYQLVIRAHPAEYILPGSLRDSVIAYINRSHPNLPKNIILVTPDSKISSYTLMDLCDCGLVYSSTTAIEMGVRGIPTLVAGEVHYRRKGFSIDVDDKAIYPELLDQVMRGDCPLSQAETMETARRYAYFAFFRTSMPLRMLHCGEGDQPVLHYNDISQLMPGIDKSLDIICDGIVSGSSFLYE